MLDSTRLHNELTIIHEGLGRIISGVAGRQIADELAQIASCTTAALIRQCLFADCVRVIHGAVIADGKVGDDEIKAVAQFIPVVARHYGVVQPSRYGDIDGIDLIDIRDFFARYAADRGPFGRNATPRWPGHALCQKVSELGDGAPLERYERLMTWLINAAYEVGGITKMHNRVRGRVQELQELKRLLTNTPIVEPKGEDLRVRAFLQPTHVFSAVAQANSVSENDPLDVTTIHAEARSEFEGLIRRATAERHHDCGRMMLILGDSGCGKTHLLRGFRQQVHEYGRGFVIYAQLHCAADDYIRYLLLNLVETLSRSYTGFPGDHSGLYELVSGFAAIAGDELRLKLARLSSDSVKSDDLSHYINQLVDELLAIRSLSHFDPELMRVLLHALHPSPAIASRVYRYLRCENMNDWDRKVIGDVTPRTGKDDPRWMIKSLGGLAHATKRSALVFMVDQAELSGFDMETLAIFNRAADALHRIVSDSSSAVAVVACLADLYEKAGPKLSRPIRDRLENDPEIQQLRTDRNPEEIFAIVSKRLTWMFAEAGAPYRPESPVYPFPAHRLRDLKGQRTRSILEWCHRFHSQCSAVGKIVQLHDEESFSSAKVPEPSVWDLDDLNRIAAAWNDALHADDVEMPDGDDEEAILAIIGTAAHLAGEEMGISVTIPSGKGRSLKLQLDDRVDRVNLSIAVTNNAPQGGGFAGQINTLRRSSKDSTAVAVRTSAFPRGKKSEEIVNSLVNDGGRAQQLDISTLRALVAIQKFEPAFSKDRIMEWRRRDRPISSNAVVASIFNLQKLRSSAQPVIIVEERSGAMEAPEHPSQPTVGGEGKRRGRPRRN